MLFQRCGATKCCMKGAVLAASFYSRGFLGVSSGYACVCRKKNVKYTRVV